MHGEPIDGHVIDLHDLVRRAYARILRAGETVRRGTEMSAGM